MIEKNILHTSAAQACSLLKCLANPHRLMLICHLLEGRKSVGELAELVGIGQSNMSQHLTQLRLHGIVATEREAQTIYYSITSEPARQVLNVLYEQFVLTNQKKVGERNHAEKSGPQGCAVIA